MSASPPPSAHPSSPGSSGPHSPDSPSLWRWVYLSGSIVFEVTATLSLRGALDYPALFLVVVAGYTAAFGLLVWTMRAGMPLGVAYGLWGATGVALTAVLSWLVFGEALTPLMWLGMTLVIAGVLCVELGSQRAQAHRLATAAGPPPEGAGW